MTQLSAFRSDMGHVDTRHHSLPDRLLPSDGFGLFFGRVEGDERGEEVGLSHGGFVRSGGGIVVAEPVAGAEASFALAVVVGSGHLSGRLQNLKHQVHRRPSSAGMYS